VKGGAPCLALLLACCARDPEAAGAGAAGVAPRGPADRPAVLAALEPADVPSAAPATSEPAPGLEIVFAARGTGVAWVTHRGGGPRVVHGGRADPRYDAIDAVALSADGRRCAYAARDGAAWHVVVDGVEGEAYEDAGPPTFSPDGAHLAYEARGRDGWRLVVDGKARGATRTPRRARAFAGDSSRLVQVEGAGADGFGRLVVLDLSSGAETVVAGSASAPVLDPEGRRFAAVARVPEGGERVVLATFERPDRPWTGPLYDAVSGIALGSASAPLAYVAEQSGTRIVVRSDGPGPRARRDAGAFAPPGALAGPLALHPAGTVVGALTGAKGAVRLHTLFAGDAAPGPAWDEAEGLVLGPDARSHAYAARRGASWSVVVDGAVGPAFERVRPPSLSSDGHLVVYRARRGGKALVVVADRAGRTLREHPAHDQVFPVRFTADGTSIAYGVRDGLELAWKVEPLERLP
jgi:hypothetical protein